MTTEFKLTELEESAYQKFRKKHLKECEGSTIISFQSSGIGYNIYVECDDCGATKDITDYGSW